MDGHEKEMTISHVRQENPYETLIRHTHTHTQIGHSLEQLHFYLCYQSNIVFTTKFQILCYILSEAPLKIWFFFSIGWQNGDIRFLSAIIFCIWNIGRVIWRGHLWIMKRILDYTLTVRTVHFPFDFVCLFVFFYGRFQLHGNTYTYSSYSYIIWFRFRLVNSNSALSYISIYWIENRYVYNNHLRWMGPSDGECYWYGNCIECTHSLWYTQFDCNAWFQSQIGQFDLFN